MFLPPINYAESMRDKTKKQRILVVGQTPPPYHGQAMMTQRLLEMRSDRLELYHVRMAFSQSVAAVGTFQWTKLFHLVAVVGRIIYGRLRYRVPTLYYMPAGPNLTPLLRDIFILTLTRPWFRQTIFHFRAAGVSDFIRTRRGLLQRLARFAYRRPDLAIHLSARNPDDGGYFGADRRVVVPNGLEDAAQPYLPIRRPATTPVRILFVGVLCASKGVGVLLEAVAQLHRAGLLLRVDVVGEFRTDQYRDQILSYCRAQRLEDVVKFPGVKQGDEKWRYFREADIFCFPSYYESESFGNVAVEAIMFGLPVVATHWRGIPDIVDDGQTGRLVPIQDPAATAAALRQLVEQPEQRQRMGAAGRARYEAEYQLSSFVRRMENVLAG